jgi:putative ABC transport system permease protein
MNANLKLALRVLRRRKVFTAISLVGITFTLVVMIIAAAIIDNVVSAARPQTHLDRMLFVYSVKQSGPNHSRTSSAGHGFVSRVVRGLDGAERVTIFGKIEETAIYLGGSRLNAEARRADGAYWRVNDYSFVEGGPYSEADDAVSRPVAVISEALRTRVFGNSAAVGRSINVAGRQHRVVGVVRDVPISRISAYAELWTPLGPAPVEERNAALGELDVIVLAKSKADIPRIQRQFNQRVEDYPIDEPDKYTETTSGLDTSFNAIARGATENAFGDRGAVVVATVLSILAFLFMLLPALNLITLNLSRALERSSEIGVRRAFGAPRHALVRQFVMENIVLTLVGGVISFILAAIALAAFHASGVLPAAHFTVNIRVFLYGMALAALFGVISGAWPAWRLSRLNPVEALRGGAH